MKVAACYNCRSTKHVFYAEENGYALVKCRDCGLLFVEDRPDDSEILQAHMQGRHRGQSELDVSGTFNSRRMPHYRRVLRDLYPEGIDGPAAWLDIGCGHGEFMAVVQAYAAGSITIRGTDPNVHKQASARLRGLDVGYFDIDTHRGKYDVISMLNVYSHLPDPPRFISSLKRLLNPGGELILETGDTADFTADEHYRPFYLPDHLSFASERIVIGILERIGFKVLSVRKYPYAGLDSLSLFKELVKTLLPHHVSRIRFWQRRALYARTDMYIRAKMAD